MSSMLQERFFLFFFVSCGAFEDICVLEDNPGAILVQEC